MSSGGGDTIIALEMNVRLLDLRGFPQNITAAYTGCYDDDRRMGRSLSDRIMSQICQARFFGSRMVDRVCKLFVQKH